MTLLTEDLGYDNATAKAREILHRLAEVPLNSALDGVSGGFETSIVRRKRAMIVEPDKDNDTVVRFVSGLAACIKLTANFYDLDDADLTNVRIRVSNVQNASGRLPYSLTVFVPGCVSRPT